MARAEIAGGSGIDASEFKGVAAALRVGQRMMYKEMQESLKAAAELVAKDAKAIVAPFSESIPPTIKAKQRGITAYVQAGGADETQGGAGPLAGLFELGNRGNKSAALSAQGFFRHPVFGVWVTGSDGGWDGNQEMHPFLVPAGNKDKAKVTALVYEALDTVIEEVTHGFGGSSTL